MSVLCLAAAAWTLTLPLQSFTLAWTHSIEKVRWEEDYRIEAGQLRLTEARIHGSGAGMEAPDGAVLHDGVWHYRPPLDSLPRLRLTRSDYVPDYEVCWDGRCQLLTSLIAPVEAAPLVEIFPCDAR